MAAKRGKKSTPAKRPRGIKGGARQVERYGWVPDLPDQRDFSYAVAKTVTSVPPKVDLRSKCPKPYDQLQTGSCTANAIAGALEFDMMQQGIQAFTPARLFIYYNERAIEGTVASDKGAFLRDGIKSVAALGACPEGAVGDPPPAWPFDPNKVLVKPATACYSKALGFKAISYYSIDQNLADMKTCLAEGYPFVFGFTAYESFESQAVATSGIVPLPASNEAVVGGHAVVAVGYDDGSRNFICRNSWGPKWGLKGYFYMPYAYLLDDNLSDDFWTIRSVTK